MRAIEKFWESMVDDAERVTVYLVFFGIALLIASSALGVHDVIFTGTLIDGTTILGPNGETITAKQVGFAWAPNWALTGIILLPLAIYIALLARGEIEPLIRRLVEQRMLVTRDFEDADAEMVINEWRRESSRWTVLTTGFFLLAVTFVLFLDFIPVVASWLLAEPGEIAELVKNEPINLHHNEYEFDWSIAASFQNAPVDRWPNLIFSSVAYLTIGMIGPGFLLAIFIWFISICSFFSARRMRRLGLRLIPNIKSKDQRLGFENFEPFFGRLAMASIFTATLALAMHLQNVFLRAPKIPDIFDMVFGDSVAAIQRLISDGEVYEFLKTFKSMSSVLDIPPGTITPQTYAAAVVFFLVIVIVFVFLWMWLRQLANKGAFLLSEGTDLTDEQLDILDEMVIWPVGWISINLLFSVVVLLAISMAYVNFLTLVLIFFVAQIVKLLVNYLRTVLKRRKRRNRRRRRKP